PSSPHTPPARAPPPQRRSPPTPRRPTPPPPPPAAEDNVFAFLRYDAEGTPLLAVSHLAPVVRADYRLGVPDEIPAWHEMVNTDAAGYGGSGITNPDPVKPEHQPSHGRPTSIRLTLPPLATVWLRPA
ncbi:alpha amylase C-terminal domain-containing protein, partial [Streptomyces sp. NPDC054804]